MHYIITIHNLTFIKSFIQNNRKKPNADGYLKGRYYDLGNYYQTIDWNTTGRRSFLAFTDHQRAIVCRKLNIDIMEWIRPTNVGCYILSILCFISNFLRSNNDHIIGVAILNC